MRVARELDHARERRLLVGTFTSAEGPAVSEIAKENKIVFIAPVPKTDRLTAPEALHPYVFRVAANTTTEGRAAAEIMSKWTQVKRVATIAPDYAYGQDAVKSFVERIKQLRPDIEIVDQQWPKLGEPDYTPFMNAQIATQARRRAVGPLLRELRHARQAGQADRLFRGHQVQDARAGRGGLGRDHAFARRRLPAGRLGQHL